jgi:hypothetical protein
MRVLDTDEDLYFVSVPIKIDYFPDNKEKFKIKCKIHFISFRFHKGDFFIYGIHHDDYSISELFNVFLLAINDEYPHLHINRGDYFYKSGTKYVKDNRHSTVLVYSSNNRRVAEFGQLIKMYKEFADIGLAMQRTDNERKKVESSIRAIKYSDIHKEQLNTYEKKLKLLKDIQVKATEIKEDYFQVLKEHILNLYLEDIEPNMSKIEEKNIELEVRHKYLKDDYDFFKTMTEEYNKLKNN